MKLCQRCKRELPDGSRFCPSCGKKISAPKSLPVQAHLVILLGAVALTGITWSLSDKLIGKAPKLGAMDEQVDVSQEPSDNDTPIKEDQQTIELRQKLQSKPTDVVLKKALIQKLWTTVTNSETPPATKQVLELLDLLSQVLQENPKDEKALYMMANISFSQKVFDKAAMYFQNYLTIRPDDYEARASYASALTFVGENDAAMSELNKVIEEHPKYFQALAYKAIALAQARRTAEAIEVGQSALQVAPSEEAKARFAQFIDSLSSTTGDRVDNRSDPVTTLIKNHPVSGPKFVKSERTSETKLTVVLREFPIDKIPEPMKASFFKKISVAAQSDPKLKEVILIDEATKNVMETVPVNSP